VRATLTYIQVFVAGGFAGVVSRTITSPLDVVKILAQVGTRETKTGFFSSFTNIYDKEGWRAFWKGNAIACLRLFPYNAIQFTAFNKAKIMLADERTGTLSMGNAVLAGGLAGTAATIITYPAGTCEVTWVKMEESFLPFPFNRFRHAQDQTHRFAAFLAVLCIKIWHIWF
jgi:solute carrier family 25 protein 43